MSDLFRRARRTMALMLIVATVIPSTAIADSTPDPGNIRMCPGEEALATLPERGSLAVLGLAALPMPPSANGRRDYENVELSWFAVARKDVCVAIFIEPDPGTEVFGQSAWARVFQPEDAWVHRDIGAAGRHCYRVVAIAPDARGPFEEVCADIRRLPTDDPGFVSVPVVAGGVLAFLGLAAILVLVRRRVFAGG